MEILVAEDDFIYRSLIQKIIESSGHKALLAEDGVKAWKLVQTNKIKIVITDWMMPNMDGLTLCRKIREAKLPNYVYLILITSKDRKEDSVRGLEAGADDYIAKPVDPDELMARIRSGERIIQLEEEQKKTHKRLLQSEKMASIGQLAAGVAHEINNPATFVNVNAGTMGKWWKLFEPVFDKAIESGWDRELGLKKFPDMVARFPRMIQSIKNGAARISSITSALREFARSDHEGKERVDIRDVIEHAVIITKNQYKYHAELVIENGSETPKIFGSSQKLEQVFINLIINATDAIKEKAEIMKDRGQSFQGLISIIAGLRQTPEKRVEIVVKDNGIGMGADVMRKVFDPFFTTKPKDMGTGLGMSIVYGIIQDHGGNISIESPKGEGAALTITLPIEQNVQSIEQAVNSKQ